MSEDQKRSIFISIPEKGSVKECSNYQTGAFISHASEVMFTVLQARFQQYVFQELPDVQAGFRKAEGPETKLPTFVGLYRKQGRSRKMSTSASLTTGKPLTVWITAICGKFLKRQKYQNTLPSKESCMRVKK